MGRALFLGMLVAVVPVPLGAQALRVASGDRLLGRVEASTLFGHPALPLTLLTWLGANVTTERSEVVVRLFGDTLQFRPGQAVFQVNGRTEPLHSWTYQEDGVLLVADWFFTRWLPGRYPRRLSYRDGVLRIGAPPPPPAAAGAAGRSVPARDTAGSASGPRPVVEERRPPSPPRGSEDVPRGVFLGFIDARVSGVFDSNIDRDPAPRPSYGTVARFGMGIQSARARPVFLARYDFALYRFAHTDEWNRSMHDVSAELAPSFSRIRLRLGAAVRLGSLTEDRQPANQIILKPTIEIRPTPVHVFSLYAVHSARRVDAGVETRSDTFRLAGVGYYLWWRGGGFWLDGRHETNASELEQTSFTGWTGRGGIRIPFPAAHRLTLEATYNGRRYAHSFVDQAGTVARADARWIASVSLTKELPRTPWELGLEYELEDNGSNDAYAAYRARRVEVTVRRRW